MYIPAYDIRNGDYPGRASDYPEHEAELDNPEGYQDSLVPWLVLF